MFKGTTHEDDWAFYHDALSLMTAKSSAVWMKEMQFKGKSYYDRWILPALGLYDDDSTLKYYKDKPVGNSPENMPLDNSLNNDLHESNRRHIAWTSRLEIDDPRKFDLSTPIRGTHAYTRIWNDVCPSSRRILQDVNKVFTSMETVRKAEGVRVNGVGECHGGGRDHRMTNPGRRGGYRPRTSDPMDYSSKWEIHPDTREARLAALRYSASVFEPQDGGETEEPEDDQV